MGKEKKGKKQRNDVRFTSVGLMHLGIAYVALPLSLSILLDLTSPAIGKPATLVSPMTFWHGLFMYATCMIVDFVKLQVAVSVS